MNRRTRKKGEPKYPEKVEHLVERLLKKWKKNFNQRELILSIVWKRVVGEQVAKHTKPINIIDRRLMVAVESAVWMNELTFMKEKIKIEAQKLFAAYNMKIEDVIFRL